jgi:hypothetical protein
MVICRFGSFQRCFPIGFSPGETLRELLSMMATGCALGRRQSLNRLISGISIVRK